MEMFRLLIDKVITIDLDYPSLVNPCALVDDLVGLMNCEHVRNEIQE